MIIAKVHDLDNQYEYEHGKRDTKHLVNKIKQINHLSQFHKSLVHLHHQMKTH